MKNIPSMPPYKLETTLRRGSACLSCRRKKLKCDGMRPVCRQCNRLNRAHACQYDDSLQKSRTQMLNEQLAALEKRLQELESLSTPNRDLSRSLEDMATFSFDSLATTGTLPRHLPCDTGAALLTSNTSSTSSSSSCPSLVSDEPVSSYASYPDAAYGDPMNLLPDGVKTYLLNVFMAHRHQCWYYCSMSRFTNPQSNDQEPHPALWNAIYLLACHYAQTPYYSEMEPALLTQTLDEINTALEISDRLLDIVQASSLIAVYMYNNNRAIEGYRQAFSAVRLTVCLGLHQLHPTDNRSTSICHLLNTSASVASPRDDVELTDQIFTFWQAFVVDRCWSAFHGLPLAFPHRDDAQFRITTPWPVPPGNSVWEDSWESDPLKTLMEGKARLRTNSTCTPALKAKVIALYDMTARLKLGKNDWSDYQCAEVAVQGFSSMMPPLSFPPGVASLGQSPVFDLDYFFVQTMVYTCFVHLQRHDLFDVRAFKAGNHVVRMISQLSRGDYQYLDPIIGACWFGVSKMFMRILPNAASIGNIHPESPDIVHISREGLSMLVTAMKTFGAFSPLSSALATKVELHPSSRF